MTWLLLTAGVLAVAYRVQRAAWLESEFNPDNWVCNQLRKVWKVEVKR